MQIRIYCIMFFVLINNVLAAQPVGKSSSFQMDKILSATIKGDEYVLSKSLSYPSGSQHIYVVKRTKDSLLVTGFVKTVDNKIDEVVSISVNDDTLFTSEVDSFYNGVKQSDIYKPYSKEILAGGYFYLTFYEENKLQVFYDKEASQSQLRMIDYVFNRLNGFSITPFGGFNPRKKYLKIDNWNDLLKYLKSGTIDSQPK